MNRDDVSKYYEEVRKDSEEKAQKEKRALAILSVLRLVIFISGVVITIKLFMTSNITGITSLVVSAVLFGIVVRTFSNRSALRDYYLALADLNSKEVESLKGDWSGFENGFEYKNRDHIFSNDIDLFGDRSFFQYINRTITAQGSDMLSGWLADPFGQTGEFHRRKQALQELSGMPSWRQRFVTLGSVAESNRREEYKKFREWMNEAPLFRGRRIIMIVAWLLPALSLSLMVMMIFAGLHYSLFVLSVLINLFFIAIRLKDINRIHQVVSKQSGFLSGISALFEHVEEGIFSSEYIKMLQGKVKSDSIAACNKIRKLSRLVQAFDNRLNMIMGAVLDGLLLWDYHCILRLEKWREEMITVVPDWFDALSEFDAMVSMAGYGFNNPDYCYGEISNGKPWLEATDMGHPLIPPDRLVTNNYIISDKGITDILTGANMSGKSTFLRTVVLNLVTAMCGGAVCANKFIFTPAVVFTSMRTADSLSENESYFYAELKRLSDLKDLLNTGSEVFFALDEILKGTNSKDKSEGSWLFLEKIMPQQGTGLVATHDISLGKLAEKYPDKIVNHCFEIDILEGRMVFDYLLREGVTTRMNAALLMKQQGIID